MQISREGDSQSLTLCEVIGQQKSSPITERGFFTGYF